MRFSSIYIKRMRDNDIIFPRWGHGHYLYSPTSLVFWLLFNEHVLLIMWGKNKGENTQIPRFREISTEKSFTTLFCYIEAICLTCSAVFSFSQDEWPGLF